MRKPRAMVVALTLLAGAALAPAAAGASAYSNVLRVYQADGSIPPCRFSSSELAAALRGVDTYSQQYLADFSDAVQTALTARAAGACLTASHAPSAAATAPQAPLPASATSPTNAGVPLPILLVAGLGLLIALVALGGAVGRSWGYEPGWSAGWRHAWAEAEYRASGSLAELADRWRTRRRLSRTRRPPTG